MKASFEPASLVVTATALLLRGEDPAFQSYIRRMALEERGSTSILSV